MHPGELIRKLSTSSIPSYFLPFPAPLLLNSYSEESKGFSETPEDMFVREEREERERRKELKLRKLMLLTGGNYFPSHSLIGVRGAGSLNLRRI
jgi:hypothetical protein